jgi:hypothetical protein
MPPAPPAAKKTTTGKGLSAKWHGVPVWVLAGGGGVGAFLLYKWYKNRQSADTTSGATSATAPVATGTTGTGSGYTGTGQGGGGGGGGNLANALSALTSAIAGLTPSASSTTTAPTSSPVVAPVAAAAFPLGPDTLTPAPSATSAASGNAPAVATPAVAQTRVAPSQSEAPGQGQLSGANNPLSSQGSSTTPNPLTPKVADTPNLFSTAGTFALPKGTVAFNPSASVKRGGQVAYGIPNQADATAAINAGGVVESGKQLMTKGWSNLTSGALYLVR